MMTVGNSSAPPRAKDHHEANAKAFGPIKHMNFVPRSPRHYFINYN